MEDNTPKKSKNLLVVFLLLGGCFAFIFSLVTIFILSAGVLTALNPSESVANAKDTQTLNNIQSLRNALNSYKVENELYPWEQSNSIVTKVGQSALPIDDEIINKLVPEYLLISDPTQFDSVYLWLTESGDPKVCFMPTSELYIKKSAFNDQGKPVPLGSPNAKFYCIE